MSKIALLAAAALTTIRGEDACVDVGTTDCSKVIGTSDCQDATIRAECCASCRGGDQIPPGGPLPEDPTPEQRERIKAMCEAIKLLQDCQNRASAQCDVFEPFGMPDTSFLGLEDLQNMVSDDLQSYCDQAAAGRRLLSSDVGRFLLEEPPQTGSVGGEEDILGSLTQDQLDVMCSPTSCMPDYFAGVKAQTKCLLYAAEPLAALNPDASIGEFEDLMTSALQPISDMLHVVCSKNAGGDYCVSYLGALDSIDETNVCETAVEMGCCLGTAVEFAQNMMPDNPLQELTAALLSQQCDGMQLPRPCGASGERDTVAGSALNLPAFPLEEFNQLSQEQKREVLFGVATDIANSLNIDLSEIDIDGVRALPEGGAVVKFNLRPLEGTAADYADLVRDAIFDFTETESSLGAVGITTTASISASSQDAEVVDMTVGGGTGESDGDRNSETEASAASALYPASLALLGALSIA